jgi:uncharacterized protein YfaS (alpha-2-macroglobulin family)
VLPGTYTLVVRDSEGCTHNSVSYYIGSNTNSANDFGRVLLILIVTEQRQYVTVTNAGSANYTYEYLIDGVVNPNTADLRCF